MKILMLSWEYPPKNIGGLSNHVYFLSQSLKSLGHEVHIITCEEGEAPLYEEDSGVFVHRVVPYGLETEDFSKWVMHMNFAMAEAAAKLINTAGKFDVVHAHDWLCLYSGKFIKWTYNIPLVSTIHATEHGRNRGIWNSFQGYISSAEWLLTFESWKVITCSSYMKEEVKEIFQLPEDKICVIPNGINKEVFDIKFDGLEFRRKYADDDEKIIFYIGRHVYEKGIQLLIEAAPDVISSFSNAKFVIAGTGVMTEELKEKVKFLGLEGKVIFTGYMKDMEKIKMYKVSDLAVFPSLYEPFGIVALEAMAAGCPVVVSDVGGLKEIVEHKVNGLKAVSSSKDSLKDNILTLLKDEKLRNSIMENGCSFVSNKYNWDNIAQTTAQLYEKIKEEAKGTEWEVKNEKPKKRAASSRKKKVEKGENEAAADIDKPKTKRKKTTKKSENK